MDIHKGVLVKTLSGRVVKVGKEEAPGYWHCDDGRIHLAAAFREPNEAEQRLYATSQGVAYMIDNLVGVSRNPELPPEAATHVRR